MTSRLRAVGAAALVAAVTVAFLPAVLPTAAVDRLVGAAGFLAAALGALALGAMGLAALGVGGVGEDGDSSASRWYPADESDPVAPSPDAERVGREIDRPLDGFGGDARRDGYRRYSVTTALRETAVDALSSRRGYSESEAYAAVSAGEWTDDVRAAALLADEDGPDLPLSVRIRDWARGRAFERRVERAVAEIELVAGRRPPTDDADEATPGPVAVAGIPKWGDGAPTSPADADERIDADAGGERA